MTTTPTDAEPRCPHCGERAPFRWMGAYHCREDRTLDGFRWADNIGREWC